MIAANRSDDELGRPQAPSDGHTPNGRPADPAAVDDQAAAVSLDLLVQAGQRPWCKAAHDQDVAVGPDAVPPHLPQRLPPLADLGLDNVQTPQRLYGRGTDELARSDLLQRADPHKVRKPTFDGVRRPAQRAAQRCR